MARITAIACVLLVVLRLSIGWQMLYEGLWKINTLKTSSPWSAEPYLKNAQGPLRDYFRSLTGDPNDLEWTSYETIAGRWDKWAADFKTHYALSESQARSLDTLLSGPPAFTTPVEALPEGLDIPNDPKKPLSYNPETRRLVINSTTHLMPGEKKAVDQKLDALDQNSDTVKAFRKSFQLLYDASARLSFKERLKVSLQADPKRIGEQGDIQVYSNLVERYEQNLDVARQPFQLEHLSKVQSEVSKKRAEVVGPVKALDSQLKDTAIRMLTTQQLARGPVPEPMTQLRLINLSTMWGLAILGMLLIAGLWTRLAALGGMVLIFMFYLAYPPIPGYPEPPGVEHSIIVNKNLIEVLALACFVALPTGRWFGVDALFHRMFHRKPAAR